MVDCHSDEARLQLMHALIDEHLACFNRENPALDFKIMTPETDAGDYRRSLLSEEQCVGFGCWEKAQAELLGFGTLIYLDQESLAQFRFLQLNEAGDAFVSVPALQVVEAPCLTLGYAEHRTQDRGLRFKISKWYMGLVRECLRELGIGCYLEVTGVAEPGESGAAEAEPSAAGKVNPGSRQVVSLAKFLRMKRIENTFEFHTLGPVYVTDPA